MNDIELMAKWRSVVIMEAPAVADIKNATSIGGGLTSLGQLGTGLTSKLTSWLPTDLMKTVSEKSGSASKWLGKIFFYLRGGELGIEAKQAYDKGDYQSALIDGLKMAGYLIPQTAVAMSMYELAEYIYENRVDIMDAIQNYTRRHMSGPASSKFTTKEKKEFENLVKELQPYKEDALVKQFIDTYNKIFSNQPTNIGN